MMKEATQCDGTTYFEYLVRNLGVPKVFGVVRLISSINGLKNWRVYPSSFLKIKICILYVQLVFHLMLLHN